MTSRAAWMVLLVTMAASAADWPQWRGPNRDGVSTEADWSVDWPADGPKRLWTTSIGKGTSSVAVVANRVYTQGRVPGPGAQPSQREAAICLDADTGKILWSYAIRSVKGDYAPHSTPTVAAGRVYVFSTGGELLCLDAASGRVVWEKPVGMATTYGHAGSPLVVENTVIVAAHRKDGTLFGLDRASGAEVWRSEYIAPPKVQPFWSSPMAGLIDGRPTVVYHAAIALLGISPADGHTLWRFDFKGPLFPKPEDASIASTPIIANGRVFASYRVLEDKSPGLSFCLGIRGGQAKIAWQTPDLRTAWHSCAALDGCIYGMDESPTPLAQAGPALLRPGQRRVKMVGHRSRRHWPRLAPTSLGFGQSVHHRQRPDDLVFAQRSGDHRTLAARAEDSGHSAYPRARGMDCACAREWAVVPEIERWESDLHGCAGRDK